MNARRLTIASFITIISLFAAITIDRAGRALDGLEGLASYGAGSRPGPIASGVAPATLSIEGNGALRLAPCARGVC